MDTIANLRIQYGALCGLLDVVISEGRHSMNSVFLEDYKVIYNNISSSLEIDIDYLGPDKVRKARDGNLMVDHFKAKLLQLKSILERGFNVTDKIVQIGSLFNSIKDEELRSRCADLLTAHDHFDRVVNQATQVLENRIRQKSGSTKSGKQLINEAIKPDLTSSILILSNEPNEHEGYTHILRGMMQTVRNSSHHGLATGFSREDSFAICGFIDQLLRIVDRATVKT